MNPWIINPPWQHFSSMVRESVATKEEQNEFLRNHHYTTTLYFGISFIEAFLNGKRREVLQKQGLPENEIYGVLRKGQFDEKVKKWPGLICGKDVTICDSLVTVLKEFNEIRGNLTHPKSSGHDVYAALDSLDVGKFVTSVAEYAVTVTDGLNERYPYWIFGWNYVTASKQSFTPLLFNDQQFVHSLVGLGFQVEAYDYAASLAWRETNMKDVEGYRRISTALASMPESEPLQADFPHMPRLCRRWWDLSAIAKPSAAIPIPKAADFAVTISTAVKWVTPIYPTRRN